MMREKKDFWNEIGLLVLCLLMIASKCRQKRKALTQELELRSSELFQKNRELKIEVNMLQAENEKLRERLLKYEESDTRV